MKKFILGIALMSVAFSCAKKCDKPSRDVNSGVIVPDTFIKEVSHNGGSNIIRSGDYKVSFNEGVTYENIDWEEYSIVRFPMVVPCNVQFDRNVEIDYPNHLVNYTIEVNSCSDCKDQYSVTNMVLVPRIPENFELRSKRIDNELD